MGTLNIYSQTRFICALLLLLLLVRPIITIAMHVANRIFIYSVHLFQIEIGRKRKSNNNNNNNGNRERKKRKTHRYEFKLGRMLRQKNMTIRNQNKI